MRGIGGVDQGERDWKRLTKSKYHDSLILLVYWKKNNNKMIISKWSILFVYFFIYKTRRVEICKVFSKFLILEIYCSLKSRTKTPSEMICDHQYLFLLSISAHHPELTTTHELQYLQGQYVLWSAQARAIYSVICPRLTLLMTLGIPIPAHLSAIHTSSLCLSRMASLL